MTQKPARSKTAKPEQSCGTCKYGRFHVTGAFLCHGETPIPQLTDKGLVHGFRPPVPFDFWGCRHYLFTPEVKTPPPPEQPKQAQ